MDNVFDTTDHNFATKLIPIRISPLFLFLSLSLSFLLFSTLLVVCVFSLNGELCALSKQANFCTCRFFPLPASACTVCCGVWILSISPAWQWQFVSTSSYVVMCSHKMFSVVRRSSVLVSYLSCIIVIVHVIRFALRFSEFFRIVSMLRICSFVIMLHSPFCPKGAA